MDPEQTKGTKSLKVLFMFSGLRQLFLSSQTALDAIDQGSQTQFHTRATFEQKKGLTGRIERKNISAGRNRRLKVPLYYKNSSFSNNLSNINYVAGRKNTSGGPHAAAGRVFETPAIDFIAPRQWFSTWVTRI